MAGKDKDERISLTDTAVLDHSWSPDGTRVAVCANTSDVLVFAADRSAPCKAWVQVARLEGHAQAVRGVAWGHVKDAILTAGEDRQVFVWKESRPGANDWTSTLVISTPVEHGATCCTFSADGNKLVVGSASRNVTVGYYDSENNWYVLIKSVPHGGSVLCVAASPADSRIVASGATDGVCRVFSTWLKKFDAAEGRTRFGQMMQEWSVGAWVLSVDISTDGNTVAFTTQSSEVCFGDVTTGQLTRVRSKHLPYRAVRFVDADAVVVAGHDPCPYLYRRTAAASADAPPAFSLAGRFSQPLAGGSAGARTGVSTGTAAAMARFQNEARLGTAGPVGRLGTAHQAAVASVHVLKSGPDFTFSTAGLDGQVFVWSSAQLQAL
eukprot:TRINITY_DN22185_c0_g1_i1.p1 TRINITY_DN22185_c0_g1~~TRINITY_DN22185_c0_g1_i1.p1  ORF type:complete len:427 (-),score=54.92 TRINITY_DN22185_c0_g1_i1:46-1185(-)